jgi:hypothetical protein
MYTQVHVASPTVERKETTLDVCGFSAFSFRVDLVVEKETKSLQLILDMKQAMVAKWRDDSSPKSMPVI